MSTQTNYKGFSILYTESPFPYSVEFERCFGQPQDEEKAFSVQHFETVTQAKRAIDRYLKWVEA